MSEMRKDAVAAASLQSVERALRWYAEEALLAQHPPISSESATTLLAVVKGDLAPSLQHLETWVSFAHTMFLVGRKDPSLPSCNLGDVLSALPLLAAADARFPWRWDSAVDEDAFSKLRFREASNGIVKTQRENREGWRAHAERNRAFILGAARGCARRELAVVLGAGQAFDLPLQELAEAFERVVLVDIDASALEMTVTSALHGRKLRARVETRVMDLSGINGQLVSAVDRTFTGPGDRREVTRELAQLCGSYRLPERPRLLDPTERADLLVSGLVLSQVSWPQRVYALRLFEQRFGKLTAEAERDWVLPWWELELRLQQDHITSLIGCAERLVLCSDVINHPTARDAAGVERETGRKIFALGASELGERVPAALQILDHAAWHWHRYRAGAAPGSRMDVEGLVLRER